MENFSDFWESVGDFFDEHEKLKFAFALFCVCMAVGIFFSSIVALLNPGTTGTVVGFGTVVYWSLRAGFLLFLIAGLVAIGAYLFNDCD